MAYVRVGAESGSVNRIYGFAESEPQEIFTTMQPWIQIQTVIKFLNKKA
jgi:hypothetical protein